MTIGWARAAQPVTFTSNAGSPRVGQTYQVAATGGDSGNPVTFTSVTSGVCSVSGSTVSVLRADTCTVRATQAGTSGYQVGTADQSVAVSRGDSAVSITSTAPEAVVQGPSYAVAVSASPSSGAVTLSTTDPEVCSLSGSTVSFGDVGQCTVTAAQAADALRGRVGQPVFRRRQGHPEHQPSPPRPRPRRTRTTPSTWLRPEERATRP